MFSQTLPRKLVQISEEALPSVQVPLVLGHNLFILSYQDVRKIEDSRLFSINQLMPNGDLKSLDIKNPSEWFLQILKQENFLCNQNLCQLLEFLNNKKNYYQQCPPQQPMFQSPQQYSPANDMSIQPMEFTSGSDRHSTIASIEQQLQWNKCVNTSSPYPMTYSMGTSTTEIHFKQDPPKKPSSCCCCLNCKNCINSKHFCNKSINTIAVVSEDESNKSPVILGAREQLKKKKLNFSFAYLN